ncbi:hypothetical protein ACQKQD_33300 [Methylobacterium sp. NPDC080182]|uniref:hypothetical protein n=1 Tax=Methylobacterium sp. NPDC080182 TaxID=3390590 RepID=UPI003D05D753
MKDKLLLAVVAYGMLTSALFGNPVQPIALTTIWADRLGIPFWRGIAALSVAAAVLVVTRLLRNVLPEICRPMALVILAILMPTMIVGLLADGIRHQAVLTFKADDVEEHSFFSSIRNAPSDLQFFLHTAALKDCKSYAWSYRRLKFYALPSRTAINVLPRAWIERCTIQINDP